MLSLSAHLYKLEFASTGHVCQGKGGGDAPEPRLVSFKMSARLVQRLEFFLVNLVYLSSHTIFLSEAGLGSKFSAGVVLGALSGLLASPFDLVRIRPVKAETG